MLCVPLRLLQHPVLETCGQLFYLYFDRTVFTVEYRFTAEVKFCFLRYVADLEIAFKQFCEFYRIAWFAYLIRLINYYICFFQFETTICYFVFRKHRPASLVMVGIVLVVFFDQVDSVFLVQFFIAAHADCTWNALVFEIFLNFRLTDYSGFCTYMCGVGMTDMYWVH